MFWVRNNLYQVKCHAKKKKRHTVLCKFVVVNKLYPRYEIMGTPSHQGIVVKSQAGLG